MTESYKHTSPSDDEAQEQYSRVVEAVLVSESYKLAAPYAGAEPLDVLRAMVTEGVEPLSVEHIDPDNYSAGTKFFYVEGLVVALSPAGQAAHEAAR